jgi:hypothetical protein
MSEPLYINLQPSEQAMVIAAAQIYAAYVISGQAKEDPAAMLKQAAMEAIRLGRTVDENVIAPGEMR